MDPSPVLGWNQCPGKRQGCVALAHAMPKQLLTNIDIFIPKIHKLSGHASIYKLLPLYSLLFAKCEEEQIHVYRQHVKVSSTVTRVLCLQPLSAGLLRQLCPRQGSARILGTWNWVPWKLDPLEPVCHWQLWHWCCLRLGSSTSHQRRSARFLLVLESPSTWQEKEHSSWLVLVHVQVLTVVP